MPILQSCKGWSEIEKHSATRFSNGENPVTLEPQFHQTVSAQIGKAFRREFASVAVSAPSESGSSGHRRSKSVRVKLDAFIAEIAEMLDASLLGYNPDFETLWRPHRLHIILACLALRDIAQAEELGGHKVRWRPSRRLRQEFSIWHHGLPYEFERIQPPIGSSTLADEFSEVLRANAAAVKEVADYVVRVFELRLFGG
jgi:hypothetical protein